MDLQRACLTAGKRGCHMKLGYQAVYDADFSNALSFAAANRFDYVSFDLNVPRFYLESLEPAQVRSLRESAETTCVGLAFHAPGDNLSLFTDYPAARRGILEHFSTVLRVAGELGARHVTLHPGIHPVFRKARTGEDDFSLVYHSYFFSVLRENLLTLLHAAPPDLLVCLENFAFSPLVQEVLLGLWEEGAPLHLTWDIAKGYDRMLNPLPGVEDFMRRHMDRVREVHVHDLVRGGRSHEVVGEGEIDFTPYLAAMKRRDVAVTIEVRPREAALISRDSLLAMSDLEKEKGKEQSCVIRP